MYVSETFRGPSKWTKWKTYLYEVEETSSLKKEKCYDFLLFPILYSLWF